MTTVDPTDDTGFFTVQEVALEDNLWGSAIAELAFDPPLEDCNGNGIEDAVDIAGGTSADCDGNGLRASGMEVLFCQ